MQALVEDVLTTLQARLEETRTEVRLPRRLPTVRAMPSYSRGAGEPDLQRGQVPDSRAALGGAGLPGAR